MATMKCEQCGHEFTARVVEDDPTTNSFVTDPDHCPECNHHELIVLDNMNDHWPDDAI